MMQEMHQTFGTLVKIQWDRRR